MNGFMIGKRKMLKQIKIIQYLFIFCFSSLNSIAAERVVNDVIADPHVQKGLKAIDISEPDNANFLVKIGGIISPSGSEHERAQAVAAHMCKIGLVDVHITDSPNVVGRIKGRSGKALIFISTLDDLVTVAGHQRAADGLPTVSKDRVTGPGTHTSSTTVATLAAAKALVDGGFIPEHDIIFAGVAQEETGLRGMRALYNDYKDQAIGFVDVLGDGKSISYGAIGIHWWRIFAEGPAGHTLNGGLPNINQAIGRAVDRILQIPEPQIYEDRRARLNVAILNSGAVFNHKPARGWFSLDVRSLDLDIIETMETKVKKILSEVSDELGIQFDMEEVSNTPPGQIEGARESTLVQTAISVSRYLGYEPTLSDAGSANLNISIAGGTLSIGLGGGRDGGRGGQRGFADEWADIPAMQRTAKNVFLSAVTMANAKVQ
jgi:acetylornithine deacetylase/succinyl-diaminopimelate desuccinylase-like protein